MSATKILWGQIVVVCLIVLVTIWGSTQWTAWRLGFQAELGPPWFELARGVPVYLPPTFFWWWYAYDVYAPPAHCHGNCTEHALRAKACHESCCCDRISPLSS